jgi:MFS family permease
MVVFHARRGIHETPRYLLAAGHQEEFSRAAGSVLEEAGSGQGDTKPQEDRETEAKHTSFWEGFRKLTSNHVWAWRLVGASAAWFLMDFAYYGNTVSSPLVLEAITPHQSLLRHTLLELLIFTVAAAPGYFVAAYAMDKIGRKTIQAFGFGVMAVAFGCLALIPGIQHLVIPFLIIYGISYFFTEFGPNATTFVYPAEIFPVESRTTGHGIASATGKIGAFVGVFLFPFLMRWHGLLSAELTAAVISLLGLLVTVTLLPEPKGKSLEELTKA